MPLEGPCLFCLPYCLNEELDLALLHVSVENAHASMQGDLPTFPSRRPLRQIFSTLCKVFSCSKTRQNVPFAGRDFAAWPSMIEDSGTLNRSIELSTACDRLFRSNNRAPNQENGTRSMAQHYPDSVTWLASSANTPGNERWLCTFIEHTPPPHYRRKPL